jgi:hypothetical protein
MQNGGVLRPQEELDEAMELIQIFAKDADEILEKRKNRATEQQ